MVGPGLMCLATNWDKSGVRCFGANCFIARPLFLGWGREREGVCCMGE